MKTKLFATLLFALLGSALQPLSAAVPGGTPDIKVVISEKKIWFVADEMPVKCLCVKVRNSDDKVVLEKCLNSKTADWSLSVEALPKGEYTVEVGKDKTVKFKR